jgi:hypothetical protein
MSNENPFAQWPHMDASKPQPSAPPPPSPQLNALPGSSPGDHTMPSNNALENFLGGSPSAVFVKLAFVSLVVGALLMWLEIRPMDILRGLDEFVRRIYALGFGAVRELFNYVLAGAALVIPAWFILRVLSVGGKK